MNINDKRNYIQSHLHELDESFIHEVYEKMALYLTEEFILTDEQEAEIQKRVDRHKKGVSKSYKWKDIKNKIKSGS